MTQKYTILDENQESQGFLILNQPQLQIQKNKGDGHLADSIFLMVCLLSFTITFWIIVGTFWIGIGISTVISIGLSVLKIWRSNSDQLDVPHPSTKNVTIKIESRINNTFYLDEIEDKSITLRDLKKVAQAVIILEKNFSRPVLEKFISQSMYHKIKTEFIRMNFAHKRGNNYILSPRAYSFLKKINNLPSETVTIPCLTTRKQTTTNKQA